MMMAKTKIKSFILLHIIFLIYSLGAIFSKWASTKIFLSYDFVFCYGIVVCILFIYAILWQQILKRMPLNTAYVNKSAVIVWGIIWGHVIFDEEITGYMMLGSAMILIGLILVVKADE
jgi:drug/metabolite transporter (DMT)-like permease